MIRESIGGFVSSLVWLTRPAEVICFFQYCSIGFEARLSGSESLRVAAFLDYPSNRTV